MINRSALIVRPAKPLLDWIRSLEQKDFSIDRVNEQTVYLVPEIDSPEELESTLRHVWDYVFSSELQDWWTDTSQWPEGRTLAMFKQWFDIEYHTVIIDLCGYPIEDDVD